MAMLSQFSDVLEGKRDKALWATLSINLREDSGNLAH
jgi:hypothetical protein